MLENFFEINKKVRFWTIGNKNAQKVIYVLHGYGQLAEYFIKNFEILSEKYFIVAPEGTHRFYLNGSSGRVGASWMTKELRDLDIEENNFYLENLHRSIYGEVSNKEFHLLGFSQGGATATRWIANSTIRFSSFTLWACVFPPDIQFNLNVDKFKDTQKFFAIGNEDEFYTIESTLELTEFYKNIEFKVILFKGKHKIDSNSLLLIFNN